MMRLLRCWIGVSGQEGKTANDKDKYKDKKITKTKTKTQRKTRIVMMRQQCQIAGRGSWKEKGGLLDQGTIYIHHSTMSISAQMFFINLQGSTASSLKRYVLVHYLSDICLDKEETQFNYQIQMNNLFQATLSYNDLSLASSLPGEPTPKYQSDQLTINQQCWSLIFSMVFSPMQECHDLFK